MPRSTKIIIGALLLLVGFLAGDEVIEWIDANQQTQRDYHVQIAIRAQQYTLRSYSNELDDSTKMAAFEESQLWLDSLKAGFAFDSKHSLNKP